MTFTLEFTMTRDGGEDGLTDYHAPKNYKAMEAHARAIKALLEEYGWEVYEPRVNGHYLQTFQDLPELKQ